MSNSGIVSVIIPAYNCEETIRIVLDSVYNQTRFDLVKEIIIINDGSTDHTKMIIEEIIFEKQDSRINLINQVNGGVSKARNIGMKHATGKYIAFLDSDDKWYPQKLEKQILFMEKHKEVSFLGSDFADYNSPNGKYYLPFKKYKNIYNLSLLELCIKNYPVTPSVIMTKTLQDKLGFFNESIWYGEDINYFQKACALYNNYYILPEPLVYIGISKDKNPFQKGLSSNLRNMQEGNYINILELYKMKKLNILEYIGLKFLYKFKYIRRLWKVRKIG